jgi:hypothetical protein
MRKYNVQNDSALSERRAARSLGQARWITGILPRKEAGMSGKRDLALRRLAKRPVVAKSDASTEAFKWAWEAIDGWGEKDSKGTRVTWDWNRRIDKAQQLAWWAVNQPLWIPRKRWPKIEGTA